MVKSKMTCPLYMYLCSIPEVRGSCIKSCPFYYDKKSASMIKSIHESCANTLDINRYLRLLLTIAMPIKVEVFGERIETQIKVVEKEGGMLLIPLPKHIMEKLKEMELSFEKTHATMEGEKLILNIGDKITITIEGDGVVIYLLYHSIGKVNVGFGYCEANGLCYIMGMAISEPIDYRKMVMMFLPDADSFVNCTSNDPEMTWKCLMTYVMFMVRVYMIGKCMRENINDQALQVKFREWESICRKILNESQNQNGALV